MGRRIFCEYCGIFLSRNTVKALREHNNGRKHKMNKNEYYSQFVYERQAAMLTSLLQGVNKNQQQGQFQ
jgi:hypothetical protein